VAYQTLVSIRLLSRLSLFALSVIVKGIAWPVAALILAVMFIHHFPDMIQAFVKAAAQGNTNYEVDVGPNGIHFKTLEQVAQITAGVIEQGNSVDSNGQPRPTTAKPDVKTIARLAANAVNESTASGTISPRLPKKVLWVDDNPQNNAGLQSAFEALGIEVVDVTANNQIESAFKREGSFDIVITDMVRDQPPDREGGLKTVEQIRRQHPGIPVIIYSGPYANEHSDAPPESPVIAVTGKPEEVFRLVTRIRQH
jgi:CheY-like chemotaxis protein